MANKTTENTASLDEFIISLADVTKKVDSFALAKIISEITQEPTTM